ncbi:phosphomannomutase/phosphoglucomutase [Candidatus Woesearchaeota archaeon]|nr:phosphomannomutase/phosphoglucomutase [Candidatus Woesearchaeota archaeon]
MIQERWNDTNGQSRNGGESARMAIDASIFKAYDIRGIYGKNLTEEIAEKIGNAVAQFLRAKTMVVGYDMRPSSKPLAASLIRGITAFGCNVLDIGLSSTDMLYFAVWHLHADGGIMVTASHNPKEYNGFKLVREKAIPIGEGMGMEEIRDAVRASSWREGKKEGRVEEKEILQDFVQFVHSFVDAKKIKRLNVVLDAGNGMAGTVAPEVFRTIPLEAVNLFFELDGNFPNHVPNPMEEKNNEQIIKKIKEVKPDLGIAWDGDCDRVFFFDEHGNRISGDFMTGIIATWLLKKNPGRVVLYDIRHSWYSRDTIRKAGGKPSLMRAGHSYFRHEMRKQNAIFGGELSGHYFFQKSDFAADNGFIPALMVLEMLSETDKKLSALLEETKGYYISGEINSAVEDKIAAMKKVEEAFPEGKHSHLDGLSIEFEDWHFNVRPSNTEPVLRLTVEALHDRKKMEAMRDKILKIIREG